MASLMGQAPPASMSSLPAALRLKIYTSLPVDERARAAAVRRSWREDLDDERAWQRLDVSATSGVRVAVTDALLRGAAARARGSLMFLDVSGCASLSLAAVQHLFTANAGALREAHMYGARFSGSRGLSREELASLLLQSAAPCLQQLEADVDSSAVDALALLRREAQFAPLRASYLTVDERYDNAHNLASATMALLALTTEALAAGDFSSMPPPPEDISAELAGALRDNTALKGLSLKLTVAREVVARPHVVIAALAGHKSLRALNVDLPSGGTLHAAMEALATLLEAGATSALLSLTISIYKKAPADDDDDAENAALGDEHLLRLLTALRTSATRLRVLQLTGRIEMSDVFARDVLLPAVRAKKSLRLLDVGFPPAGLLAVRKAAALVLKRGEQEEAAA
jgi:hypothetical protein